MPPRVGEYTRRAMVRKTFTCAAVMAVAAGLSMRAPYAQDTGRGAALFADTCASCHGVDARGLNGPSLTTLFAPGPNTATAERVFETIRRGVAGSMPPSTASDEDVRALVAHLKSLAAPTTAVARAAAPTMATIVMRGGQQIRGAKKNED